MSECFSICCSGWFPYLPCYELTLPKLSKIDTVPDSVDSLTQSERFRIDTFHTVPGDRGMGLKRLSCDLNFRLVEVPLNESSSPRRIVAVRGQSQSGGNSNHINSETHDLISIYDVDSQEQISQYFGHSNAIYGLSCVSVPGLCSNPVILPGNENGSEVEDDLLILDAMEGTKVGSLEDSPRRVYRILHVPEWNLPSVFLGSSQGNVYRYDVETGQRMGVCQAQKSQSNAVGTPFSSPVFGLSASIAQKLIFSVSQAIQRKNRKLRVWSRDGYQCEMQVPLSDAAHCCCYVEEKGLLLIGLDSGTIDVRDVRKLSLRWKSFAPFDFFVHEIENIRDDLFVGVSDDFSFSSFDLNGKVWKTERLPGQVKGMCVFSSEGLLSSDRVPSPPNDDTRDGEGGEEAPRNENVSDVLPVTIPVKLSREEFGEEETEGEAEPVVRKPWKNFPLSGMRSQADVILSLRVELYEKTHQLVRKDEEIRILKARMRKNSREVPSASVAPSRVLTFLSGLDEDSRKAARSSEAFCRNGYLGCSQALIPILGSSFVVSCLGRPNMEILVDFSSDTVVQQWILDLSKDGDLKLRFADSNTRWYDAFQSLSPSRIGVMEKSIQQMSVVVGRIGQAVVDFFGGEITVDLRQKCWLGHPADSSSIRLGDLKGRGLLCHRALLFKHSCDCLGIPCRLHRIAGDVVSIEEEDLTPVHVAVRIGNMFFIPELGGGGGSCSLDLFDPTIHLWDSQRKAFPVSELENVSEGLAQAGLEPSLVSVKEVTQLSEAEIDHVRRKLMLETHLLRTLRHRNVVELLGSFRISSPTEEETLCLVTKQYSLDGKSLLSTLRTVVGAQVRTQESLVMLLSVANGLQHLQSERICHLHLDPSNILVEWNEADCVISEVCLSGFGFVGDRATATPDDFCAPEVSADVGGSTQDHPKAEIFSFGAVMRYYEEFLRQYPILIDLCSRCLSVQPSDRPSLFEIMYLLRQSLLVVEQVS